MKKDKKYVVYLTSYTGTLLPPFYIGSTSEDKILSNNYFGSVKSKKWKDIFNSELSFNKHLFTVKILSLHNTREEALSEEFKVQILNNVIKSKEYFNESLASPNGFFGRDVSGSNNPTFGLNRYDLFIKKYGEELALIKWNEMCNKRNTTLKGLTRTPEQKMKMSIACKQKDQISGMTGKKQSQETKDKIRLALLKRNIKNG